MRGSCASCAPSWAKARGKADYSASGRITVNMLDLYVSERVKELTQGEQNPTTVKPPNVPDFPVVLVK
jgi:hypothetical protein